MALDYNAININLSEPEPLIYSLRDLLSMLFKANI